MGSNGDGELVLSHSMTNLVKAAFQVGGAAVIAIVFQVLVYKFLAIVLSTEGVGLFSLLNQLRVTTVSLALLGGSTAITRGVSAQLSIERARFLSTTFWLYFFGCLLVTSILIVFAPWVAQIIIGEHDPELTQLVRILVIPVILSLFYAYFNSVLTGYRSLTFISMLRIVGPVAMAITALPLALAAKQGTLFALIWLMVVGSGLQMILGYIGVRRIGWKFPLLRRDSFDLGAAKTFFALAGVVFITGQFGNLAKFAVNASITQSGGYQEAGLFNASWNVTVNYVVFISTALSAYYLPTAASLMGRSGDLLRLMRDTSKFTLFAIVPIITGLMVFKPLVIEVMYSSEFIPSIRIFRWMLIGDYFKLFAMIVYFPALAAADTKVILGLETLKWFTFAALSFLLLRILGASEGVGVAFLLHYIVYAASYLFYSYRRFGFRVPNKQALMWVGGLCIICLAAVSTWGDTQVEWGVAGCWVVAACLFSWMIFSNSERKKIKASFRHGAQSFVIWFRSV